MKILHLIDHMGLGGAQIVLTHIIQNKKNHKAFILDSRKNQSNIKTPRFISSKSQSKLSLYPLLELKKTFRPTVLKFFIVISGDHKYMDGF